MKVYKADIRAGKVKVMSAEVTGETDRQWEVKPRSEIGYLFNRLDKSEVFETPQLAVDALMARLRRSIERATSEIKSDLRDLERCHEWKLSQQCTALNGN